LRVERGVSLFPILGLTDRDPCLSALHRAVGVIAHGSSLRGSLRADKAASGGFSGQREILPSTRKAGINEAEERTDFWERTREFALQVNGQESALIKLD
jgi:hypothetical protein